jgi:uncharacterized protein with FMN-binding domain
MRRALFAVSGTIAGLVMLLSFKTQSPTVATPPVAAGSPDAGGSSPDPAAAPSAAAPSSAASSAASSRPAAGTFTGDAADTRWGPVQVQVTVANGAVTAVTAVEYPQNNPRDVEINQFAIPQLNQEASAAGSARIDMVSGATVTSEGYLQSLQSALDKAGL